MYLTEYNQHTMLLANVNTTTKSIEMQQPVNIQIKIQESDTHLMISLGAWPLPTSHMKNSLSKYITLLAS
jgi:hypothetical protein